MRIGARGRAAALFLGLCSAAAFSCAAGAPDDSAERAADDAVRPAMAKYGIPGEAVAIKVEDKPSVFSHGVAFTATGRPTTRDTLFELGSVTKTFTAALAAQAQIDGRLALSDPMRKYLPSLRSRKFGEVRLLDPGTHTPGGPPLQVPDHIRNNDDLIHKLVQWRPTYAPGTHRTYANPGVGMLGLVTAKFMGRDFAVLIGRRLFPALGMTSSHIHVPAGTTADPAQGYTKEGAPIRMKNGVGAPVAFVPQDRWEIVILANNNFPIDARVTAAYEILASLAERER